jgi:predicted phage terminase large subunit-like protein
MTTEQDIQPLIDEQVNRALAKLNFWEFVLYYDQEFFEKRKFLKPVANALQVLFEKFSQGIAIKVAISMSPRAGKSYIVSLFCAWFLGKFPELCVMRNTVTSHLYNKFSYDVRDIIKSKRFQNVFPTARLAEDKQNIAGWALTSSKQGAYFGGGVGTNIIGFGANLAITDDLYSGFEQALSETYSEKVMQWKQGSHDSRKEKSCPEIFIGTRWSKNDVIGKAIEAGDIDIEIKIPALIEGRSFCEDVKSTEEYMKIKADVDETIWEAEYMQEPIEAKGLLFPKSELKFFSPMSIEPEFRYCAVDPADKGFDDTSAPFCDLIGKGIYVTDVIYNNHGTDITIPNLVEKLIEKKVNNAEIEGVSAWILFGKDVRTKVQDRYQDCEIRIIKNTANKQTRILAQSAFIKNHFYFLEEEYWDQDYRKFMKVLTAYMREGSSKDDAPDSLAMASAYFMRQFSHLW